MINNRKNEAKGDIDLFNHVTNNKHFSKVWFVQKQNNSYIQQILDKSSKKSNGNKGYPDLIYVNESKKLLILVENKDSVKNHVSKEEDKPLDYAVDGIKHYLSFFINDSLNKEKEILIKYFKDWKFIGIAFSGDINDEYNHTLDTFVIKENLIKNIGKKEFLDENDYLAYFENIDLEKISNEISKSSAEINRLLRNLDSQKRPILLSALMICLYPEEKGADFKNSYSSWGSKTIIRNIPTTISDILENEHINPEKIKILINELSFIKTDKDLNSTDILKDILKELEEKVIPLFEKKTSYDIIGKFYEEFLRYAGITNVKKGIVLTPNHITTLFTDLIDIKTNDVIFDPACGTGAFLIAGMNKLISEIENSTISDKTNRIKNIKTKQLIGFEKSSTMYFLAISNMLFIGDGKSKIFNEDFFSNNAKEILENLNIKPTIGFVNPPYGGKDNKSNPTKREIQFLEKMLDICSRYGIIIAPLSTFFKDNNDRNRILSKHTLKYVINMPSELFQPNAATHTAIVVFETNKPHNNHEVIFYNLKDDGFVLSKNKGRTDLFNRWNTIKKELLNKINNVEKYQDNLIILKKKIKGLEEWLIQAHSETDYSKLSQKDFERKIKEQVIFNLKCSLNLLEKNFKEVDLFDMFEKADISNLPLNPTKLSLNISKWKTVKLWKKVVDLDLGKPVHKIQIESSFSEGRTPYITRTAKDNGTELFLDVTEFKDKISKGNCITIGAEGLKAYFQSLDFLTGNKVNILRNENINKYNSLFLIALLDFQMEEKFSYGRAVVKGRLEEMNIKLPVDKNGLPDWKYMEDYIKSLPYSSVL